MDNVLQIEPQVPCTAVVNMGTHREFKTALVG